MSLLPPSFASKYTIEKLLGQGSYGSVYLVYNNTDPRKKYAIKTSGQSTLSTSDVVELSILRRLNHPNIVRLFDIDYDFETGNLASRLELAQTDLHHVIRKAEASIEQRLHFLYNIVCGLNYVHSSGILHLDLKPQNILVFQGSQTAMDDAKIADFGLADRFESNRSPDKVTLWWRPPEIACGEEGKTKYGPGADMWSVGAIAWDLFCSPVPLFPAANESNLYRRIVQQIGMHDSEWQNEYQPSGRCPALAFSKSKSKAEQIQQLRVKYANQMDELRNPLHFLSYMLPFFQLPSDFLNRVFAFITSCLQWNESDRMTAAQAMADPLFHETMRCECEHCQMNRGYRFNAAETQRSDSNTFNTSLEKLISGETPLKVYAHNLFRRYESLSEDRKTVTNAEHVQAACISLAKKLLNFSAPSSRVLRNAVSNKQIHEYSELEDDEILLLMALDFDLDGPWPLTERIVKQDGTINDRKFIRTLPRQLSDIWRKLQITKKTFTTDSDLAEKKACVQEKNMVQCAKLISQRRNRITAWSQQLDEIEGQWAQIKSTLQAKGMLLQKDNNNSPTKSPSAAFQLNSIFQEIEQELLKQREQILNIQQSKSAEQALIQTELDMSRKGPQPNKIQRRSRNRRTNRKSSARNSNRKSHR